MTDLFQARIPDAPLADALRPQRLEDVLGQPHLLSEGKPLKVAFESGKLHSMILWGPPGSGKTTLARLMAQACDCQFIPISAVLSGVKDIREAVERAELARAQFGRQTILFVDEVHRFNKAQQDAFLPYVEQGLFTFIGATTENPSFEVNSALLSRATVYMLNPLSDADLEKLVERAMRIALSDLDLADGAKKLVIGYADGDARRLLNMLEIVATATRKQGTVTIDEALAANALALGVRRFDKGGDVFYDQISALHKSVRGSAHDAALYWLARMLDGGADPRYLARRLVRMAVEDVGLADPRALAVALDCAETYERLGSPEGELALAQAALYLACAPKSNAVYVAYTKAGQVVSEDKSRPVPEHLRNAPTRLMKELGFGRAYRYAHDEPEAYAAGENYFPEGIGKPSFYEPTGRGLEAKIAERIKYLRELDAKTKKKM